MASVSASDDGAVGDRFAIAATALRAAGLLFVAVLALVPVAGVLAGAVPFDPPDPTMYYVLVGASLVGTLALIAAGVLDV